MKQRGKRRKKAALLAAGALGLLGAGLVIAAGCSLVTSYDGFSGATAPTCGKRVPDRPATSANGKNGGDLIGALTLVRFLDPPDASPLGFDLDKLCTCPDKRACNNPKAADQQCDVPNLGIDNAAGSILNLLFPPQADAQLQESLRHGRNGIVVRVQGWDGSPDDADVSVAVFNVVGLKGDEDGGAPAKFEGNDEFIVDDDSLLNVMTFGPRYFDTSAYVTKGVLVASLDYDFRIEVPNALDASSVVFIPLRSARLVGKIEKVGTSGLALTNAQFVGRLPVESIFAQVSGIGLCRDAGIFTQIKASTCAALDLPLKPVSDGKNVGCDALSFAIGVRVAAARIGGHAAKPGAPSPCGEEPVERCQ